MLSLFGPVSGPKKESCVSTRSPSESAKILLWESGIKDLSALSRIFLGDSGRPVDLRCGRPRIGLGLASRTGSCSETRLEGWLVLEELPEAIDSSSLRRARAFRSLEGALVDFCTKVALHDGRPDPGQLELSTAAGTSESSGLVISFKAPGRKMVLSPMEVALEAALAL